MPQIRHGLKEQQLLVRTLSLKLQNGSELEGHEHPWPQAIFASRGVMQVDAGGCRWVVPPMRCLFIPAKTGHSIRIVSETWMRTIYLRPGISAGLPLSCSILDVSPLLRELILQAVRMQMLSEAVPAEANLAAVLADQLAAAGEIPLKTAMPTDPRGKCLADIISRDPANKKPLSALARLSGASPRTLERIFINETGLSLGRWRQRARLMMGIRLLIGGSSVAQSALASGYESPSAFVAMFKREMGTTPGQYMQRLRPE